MKERLKCLTDFDFRSAKNMIIAVCPQSTISSSHCKTNLIKVSFRTNSNEILNKTEKPTSDRNTVNDISSELKRVVSNIYL